MLCAILSAVYDYDTDWTFGNRQGDNFFPLLKRIKLKEARTLATNLFNRDNNRNISADGLERGSIALRFYVLVINSVWMSSYTPKQIRSFGRKLQIIDDILDREGDLAAGDTNCLLFNDRTQEFLTEAAEFLKSDFFGRLKRNSQVYAILEGKVRKTLRNSGMRPATLKQLFATGRPKNGLYASVLSFIGFGFYEGTPWHIVLLTGIAFAGLTMSIMIFNDWVDRENDRKKRKMFASEHSQELMRYWQRLSCLTTLVLVPIAYWSIPLTLYITLIWTIGIMYSYARQRHPLNNIIVALCSGSPALCGMIYYGEISRVALYTFGIYALLIFVREIHKDIQDIKVDPEYKRTMPLNIGTARTIMFTTVFLYAPALLLVLYPNPWITWLGVIALGFITFQQSFVFLHPYRIGRAFLAMRLTQVGLLVLLLVT